MKKHPTNQYKYLSTVTPKSTYVKKVTFAQREEIIKKHFEEGITQTQLAKDYGVSRHMIGLYCKRHGGSPLRTDIILDDAKIIDLFVNKKWSVLRIAQEIGVTPKPIKRRLKLAGIDYRPTYQRKKFEETVPHYRIRLKIWENKILERDEIHCKLCDVEYSHDNRLEAHHITPVRFMEKEEQLFSMENGITLCRVCHMKVHYKELDYADLFRGLITITGSV